MFLGVDDGGCNGQKEGHPAGVEEAHGGGRRAGGGVVFYVSSSDEAFCFCLGDGEVSRRSGGSATS